MISLTELNNASEEEQIAAVKENGYAIQYIKNPSEQVQLEAVKENGFAIECIQNPSQAVIELLKIYDIIT